MISDSLVISEGSQPLDIIDDVEKVVDYVAILPFFVKIGFLFSGKRTILESH